MKDKDQKVLHTADWHLGAPTTWGPALNRSDMEQFWIDMFSTHRKNAIRCIVSEAIKNNVIAVLVAGDMIDVYGIHESDRQIRMKDAKDFIQNDVIEPLARNGIMFLITSGSHELRSNENTKAAVTARKEMITILLDLIIASKGNAQLLVDEEIKCLLNNAELIKLARSSVLLKNLIISCEQHHQGGDWIEFFHGEPRPVSRSHKPPMYRAFGHKHGLTRAAGECWYPGMPFPRSSASDATSEVGPRYCLLFKAGDVRPEPIKLKVPEIAVMKKALFQDSWQLLYQPGNKVTLKGPADRVLDQVRETLPQVHFVTMVVDTEEQGQYRQRLLEEAIRFNKDRDRVITANRMGIVTIMVKDFDEGD